MTIMVRGPAPSRRLVKQLVRLQKRFGQPMKSRRPIGGKRDARSR